MPEIKILSQGDLERLVPLDHDAIACVEDAFRALATQPVVMPAILRLDIADANGEVDVKTAYVPGIDSFAIKISPGFFNNPQIGLPSVNGLMVLLSAKTGLVEAMLLDNGYLTDVRTAAAGAVAAKHLSSEDASAAAIIGAGMQAQMQAEALCLVRPITEIALWARDRDKAQKRAATIEAATGTTVVVAESIPEAIKGRDIIVTTTPSSKPLIEADLLEPGQHLTAMGSDAEHKNEIDPNLFRLDDLVYVADRLSQTRILGELHHALEKSIVPKDATYPELGEIIAGAQPGRTSAHQITFADLTGTGVQDTAIATLARQRAYRVGAGTSFKS